MDPTDPDPQHCLFAWKNSLFVLPSIDHKTLSWKTGFSTFSIDQKYEDFCDIKKIFFIVGL
jgi:hypothetical protein